MGKLEMMTNEREGGIRLSSASDGDNAKIQISFPSPPKMSAERLRSGTITLCRGVTSR